MKITTKLISLRGLKTDLLAIGVLERDGEGRISDFGHEIDHLLQGQISRILKREKFKGKAGESRLLDVPQGLHDKIGAHALLLAGLGTKEKFEPNVLRKAAACAVRTGKKLHASHISLEDFVFAGKEDATITPEIRGQALAEGVVLGNYSFDLYKSKKKKEEKTVIQNVDILTSHPTEIDRGAKKGLITGEATNFARELINIPASDLTPRRMAEEARKIGRLSSLSVRILDKKQAERLGMGCFLAVAKGSTEPPYFIHLHYKPPKKPEKKIVLIGKGVTFDSGGLSLKPPQGMETMKDDMSGAAAIVSVMKALSALKPDVEVHGLAAMTENMPSGSANKPGDVARAMNGKTVEILNTDAEGRLTLADALCYAKKLKPDLIIDIATLTGACVIALGELCSGILGNDQDLINRLIESGRIAGEKIWQLPLIEEYKEELKSTVADLKNVGGRWGGTINGALFLQEFVDSDSDSKTPWAHIDIAGPSWAEKDLGDCPRGGTGSMVRTLLQFLQFQKFQPTLEK